MNDVSEHERDTVQLSGLTTEELEGLIARLPPEDELLDAALAEYDRRTPLDTAARRAGLKAEMGLDDEGSGGGKKPSMVKLFVLLAAALALAGTALAALSHTSMFRAVFVSPDGGEPVTVAPSEYSYTDGDLIITYMLPGYELTKLDEDAARRLLEPYVVDLGKQYVVDGYTITLISYLRDEAGTDRLYYSIENPEGLDNMSVSEFNGYIFAGPKNDRPGLVTNTRSYLDTARSTDTKFYICVTSTAGRPEDYIEEYPIYGERTGDPDAYEPPVEWVTIDVPACVPAVTAEAEGYAVALSPMGLRVTDLVRVEANARARETGGIPIHECPRYVSVTFSNGEEYVVWEQDKTDNTTYACGYESAGEIYCLNRLVDPAEVQYVTVDGHRVPLR